MAYEMDERMEFMASGYVRRESVNPITAFGIIHMPFIGIDEEEAEQSSEEKAITFSQGVQYFGKVIYLLAITVFTMVVALFILLHGIEKQTVHWGLFLIVVFVLPMWWYKINDITKR